MQQVSLELFDHRVSFYQIRYCSARTELIDGDDHFFRSNWTLSSLAVKCIVVLPPPLLLNFPLSRVLVQRKIGWPNLSKLSSIFSAVRSKDPLGLQLYVAYRFFCEPSPRKDQWLRRNCRAYSSTLFELFSHNSAFPVAPHSMSLNIDMKMILPLKSARSHFNSTIIF